MTLKMRFLLWDDPKLPGFKVTSVPAPLQNHWTEIKNFNFNLVTNIF